MSNNDYAASRRRFIAAIGADAAALLLPFGGASVLNAQCAPPGNTTNPTAWNGDCRAIRTRRPASTLTSSEINKLRAAYTAMRALDTTDAADPRGFRRQANIHCFHCAGEGPQVHFGDNFLPWHRGYLYFHERILGKLIGDMDLRLPYWDWENPADRRLPPSYATPGNNGNSLWNSTRAMSPTDTLPAGDVDLSDAFSQTTFSTFSDSIESIPHGPVHVDVGGDMSAFSTAGRDPIFFTHHGNIDKAWSDWNAASASNTNPTSAAWLNTSWGFFDENKVWRTIKNSDVTNHSSNLRYVYGTRVYEYISILCIRRWRDFQLVSLAPMTRFRLDRANLRDMQAAVEKKTPVHMQFTGVELPRDRSAVYNAYLTQQEAQQNKGEGSPGYLGIVPVVVADPEGRHKLPQPRYLSFNLAGRMRGLTERADSIEVYLADRKAKEGQVRVLQMRAKGVSIRVAELG